MKKIYLLSISLILSLQFHSQVLIAGWDFQTTSNGGTAAATAPNSPILYTANFGTGSLYLDGTNGSSTFVTVTSGNQLTSFGGTNVNAASGFNTSSAGASSLSLVNSTANGKGIVFLVNMSTHNDLIISYATRYSGSTGFTTQTWEYSTNGTSWTSLSTQTGFSSSFATRTLPTLSAVNGISSVYIRMIVSGASATSGNNRLDNIQFNATLITTCDTPGNQFINNITSSSATLNWTAPAATPSGYEYEIRTSGTGGSGATGLVSSGTTSSLSFNVLSLSGSTNYNMYLRSDCSGTYSNWTSAYSFTTLTSPPIATLSDNGTPIPAASIYQGMTNFILSSFKVNVTNSPDTLTSVTLNTNGIYVSSDVANFKLWYSPFSTLSTTTATQLGTTLASTSSGSGETLIFNGFSNIVNTASVGYYFLTLDINSTAIPGNKIGLNQINTSDLIYNSGSSNGSTTAIGFQTILIPATLTELIFPQYAINGTSSNNRLQYVCRLQFNNLTPNATYRYFSSGFAGGSNVGNTFFISNINGASGHIEGYTDSKSLGGTLIGSNEFANSSRYGEFMTNSSGVYEGWFSIVPTGNSVFNAGSAVSIRVSLNNGAGGTNTYLNLTSALTFTMLNHIAGTNEARSIYGSSNGTAENMVFLYDNTSGSGRPLYGTWIENDGITTNFTNWYAPNVEGNSGKWGAYIPSANANGVQRIEQRSTGTGNIVGCPAIDADGIWPSGVNTVNPTVGANTPLVITTSDAPLNTAVISSNLSTVSGLTPQCTDNSGWTYYGAGNDYAFAINKGSSGLTGETVDLEVLSSTSIDTSSLGTNKEHASFLMKNSWNVNGTIPSGQSVSVRFYYLASDSLETVYTRDTTYDTLKLVTNTSSLAKKTNFEWFKTVNIPYDATWRGNIVGNQFPSSQIKLTPSSWGMNNGLNYVEFSGITSFSGGTGGVGFGPNSGASTPLPVTWEGFEVKTRESGNELTWKTASEKNMSHFELEYSYDGINYKTMNFKVKAAGNSASLKSYNYTHVDFSSFVYYRVKQVDMDNQFEYSETKLAKRTSEKEFQVSIYPTRILDEKQVNIKLTSIDKSKIEIKIIDMTGKVKFNKIQTPSSNSYFDKIDISDLNSGIYFVEISNGQGRKITKILK